MVTINGKKDIKLVITEEQINHRIDQIEKLDCDDDLRRFMIDALEALVAIDRIVGLKNTTIVRLRKIFNKQSEKRPAKPNQENTNDEGDKKKSHPRGNKHGKNGRAEYPNADKICHAHENLKFGDKCPECGKGSLGRWGPGVYIRITGSPSFRATIHETEKFRCNACQKIFEADFAGKTEDKYDAKALAILAILKYRASMPFYRIEKIQKQLLTPMPASTQWDLIEKLANILNPIWLALLKYAANGNLYFIDDTKAKILDLLRENKEKKEKNEKKFRKGIYTTGIVSEIENHKIVLYLTGRKYAGENLTDILNHRDHTDPPIVSSDAAATNNIHSHHVLKALCNVHSRRSTPRSA